MFQKSPKEELDRCNIWGSRGPGLPRSPDITPMACHSQSNVQEIVCSGNFKHVDPNCSGAPFCFVSSKHWVVYVQSVTLHTCVAC